MSKSINIILLLFVTALSLSACSSSPSSPYNDPDGQRERAKDAQREMGRY